MNSNSEKSSAGESGMTYVSLSQDEIKVLVYALEEKLERIGEACNRYYWSHFNRGYRWYMSDDMNEFVRLAESIRIKVLGIKPVHVEHDWFPEGL